MFHMTEISSNAAQEFCAQVWWLVLLRGIAVSILGGLLIARPEWAAAMLVQCLGAYLLVDGSIAVFKSSMWRKHSQNWGWGLLMGALEVLIGIFIFGHPFVGALVTATMLVYYVAFLVILAGLLGLITGIQLLRELNDRVAAVGGLAVALTVAGVLAIIFGVILLVDTKTTATIYLSVMGVIAVIGGVVQILAAFQIRQVGKQVEPRATIRQ